MLSRSSSYSVLEDGESSAQSPPPSPGDLLNAVGRSWASTEGNSSSPAYTVFEALYDGGSRGVFQWVEATAQVGQVR